MDRSKKKVSERHANPLEILYIFDKSLEGWKTIKIWNVLKQERPDTKIIKKDIDKIARGDARIEKFELNEDQYKEYEMKRAKIYEIRKKARSVGKLEDSVQSDSCLIVSPSHDDSPSQLDL